VKTAYFLGQSLDIIRHFPKEVREEIGFAIENAQNGSKALNVVPLVGFGGASVLEIIANGSHGTYRAVYTVRFPEAIYLLHAFQKKSRRGIATPKSELALVRARLKVAQEHYEREYEKQTTARQREGRAQR
jgi:phage-related protein